MAPVCARRSTINGGAAKDSALPAARASLQAFGTPRADFSSPSNRGRTELTDIRFDLRDFEREAKRLGAAVDQVPYALARCY